MPTRGASKKREAQLARTTFLNFLRTMQSTWGLLLAQPLPPSEFVSVALLGAAGGIAALKHENDRAIRKLDGNSISNLRLLE